MQLARLINQVGLHRALTDAAATNVDQPPCFIVVISSSIFCLIARNQIKGLCASLFGA